MHRGALPGEEKSVRGQDEGKGGGLLLGRGPRITENSLERMACPSVSTIERLLCCQSQDPWKGNGLGGW